MSILRKKLIGRKGGFTLIELLMVVAIIGILSAIAMPIYASMQAKAQIAKAQSDVATLAEAFSAFGAHCGDVPGTAANLTGAGGGNTCTLALGGTGLTPLLVPVTDANNVSSGPFMGSVPAPPGPGFAYSFTRNGVANFVVTATGPNNFTFSKP